MTVGNRTIIKACIERLAAVLDDKLTPLQATQIIQAIGSLKYALSRRTRGG